MPAPQTSGALARNPDPRAMPSSTRHSGVPTSPPTAGAPMQRRAAIKRPRWKSGNCRQLTPAVDVLHKPIYIYNWHKSAAWAVYTERRRSQQTLGLEHATHQRQLGGAVHRILLLQRLGSQATHLLLPLPPAAAAAPRARQLCRTCTCAVQCPQVLAPRHLDHRCTGRRRGRKLGRGIDDQG